MVTRPLETRAWIGLGANLGDREAALRSALVWIGQLPRTQVLRTSSFYTSAPIDAHGPDYLNAAAEVSTTLDPHALLKSLQAIEHRAGRKRPFRNAPRTLDLDILLWGNNADEKLCTPALTIPHPRMYGRAFVLLPLAEIAPDHVSAQALAMVSEQHVTLFRPAP